MPDDVTIIDRRVAGDRAATGAESEPVYLCAACGSPVTRARWAIAPTGDHERTVFNPAGIVFRILVFGEAPGADPCGAAFTDFTWFSGFAWRLALCRGCGVHLGWRYEGETAPRVFFGLIKDRLRAAEEPR